MPYGLPPPADDVAPRGTKAWRQAVNARRAAVGNSLWGQQANNRLDLSDPVALSAALARMGITDEVGGGRHLRRLFMGDLPSEGFGMSSPERGISYALEAYMPTWKIFRDKSVQAGNPPRTADSMYLPQAQAPSSAGMSSLSAPGLSGTSGYGLSGDAGMTVNPAVTDFLKRRRGVSLGTL